MNLKTLEFHEHQYYVDEQPISVDCFCEAMCLVQRTWLVEKHLYFDPPQEGFRLVFDLDRLSPVVHFSDPYDYP